MTDHIDEVTIARIDLCRERIEREYGREISQAVGKIMNTMMLQVVVESIERDVDGVQLLAATCKAIGMIDGLAEDYHGKIDKVRNN